MNIRKIDRFTVEVYNAVIRLLPQLDSESVLPSKEHFKKILRSDRSHFFIAELDSRQIVGMLTIATYDIPSGTKVWIEDVVVDGSQRGKGFGRELMLFAVDFARTTGAKAIELTSRPSRIAANKLYRELGFVIRETNMYKLILEDSAS